MKKLSLLATSAAALLLSSCSGYVSHWNARMFVHSNTSHSALMEFDEFSGLMVLNMRASEGNGSTLKYETKLGEGKFTISYATDEKVAQEIFTIEGGQTKNDTWTVPAIGAFYLLVESEGTAKNGKFEFNLVH